MEALQPAVEAAVDAAKDAVGLKSKKEKKEKKSKDGSKKVKTKSGKKKKSGATSEEENVMAALLMMDRFSRFIRIFVVTKKNAKSTILYLYKPVPESGAYGWPTVKHTRTALNTLGAKFRGNKSRDPKKAPPSTLALTSSLTRAAS